MMSKKSIPLTDRDLRQMDDEWVSALTSSETESLLVRTLFELRKSRDRLNQSPRNSSKPPSTRASRETAANAVNLEVTRHTPYARTCACGHVTRAALNAAPDDPFWDKVALGQWRQIGPRLASAIVFLARCMRLSRARIREFFLELFDLRLSTGVLDEIIREAGRAVAALEDDMVQDIEQAVLLHADETPWKEAGRPQQVLRHWVIARRLSMGTRSEAGTRAFALLASVIETCRKRAASYWVFIASVIAAARKGLAIPSLPAIPARV